MSYDFIDLDAAWEAVDLNPKLKKVIERYLKKNNIKLIMASTPENNKRWDIDFRSDGMRGVCPRCGEHFETENRKGGLRSGMDEHYKNCHPKRVPEATAYMNKIEKEIEEELKTK